MILRLGRPPEDPISAGRKIGEFNQDIFALDYSGDYNIFNHDTDSNFSR
jgi:hypothetical protein